MVAQMDKKEMASLSEGKLSGEYSLAGFRGRFLWPYASTPIRATARRLGGLRLMTRGAATARCWQQNEQDIWGVVCRAVCWGVCGPSVGWSVGPSSLGKGLQAQSAYMHLLLQDFHLLSFLEGQVIWVDAIVGVQGHHNVSLLLWI